MNEYTPGMKTQMSHSLTHTHQVIPAQCGPLPRDLVFYLSPPHRGTADAVASEGRLTRPDLISSPPRLPPFPRFSSEVEALEWPLQTDTRRVVAAFASLLGFIAPRGLALTQSLCLASVQHSNANQPISRPSELPRGLRSPEFNPSPVTKQIFTRPDARMATPRT